MKFILFEFDFEIWKPKHHTFLLKFCCLDYIYHTSLLEIGFYQGDFIFDFLFIDGIKCKIEEYMERCL